MYIVLLRKTKSILQSFDSKDFKDYWHIIYVPEHICNDKRILSTWDCVSYGKRIMKCVFNINVDQMLHRLRLSGALNQIKNEGQLIYFQEYYIGVYTYPAL